MSTFFKRPLRVLAIGEPTFALDEFKALKAAHTVEVVQSRTHGPTASEIAEVAKTGQFDAALFFHSDLFNVSNWPAPFDEALLAPLAPHCRMYSAPGAGFDWADVKWMEKTGAYYANCPVTPSLRTADATSMMILQAMRGTSAHEFAIRSGGWRAPGVIGIMQRGRTLGLIGMGRISKYIAKTMIHFGMNIVYTKRTPLSDSEVQAEFGADASKVRFVSMNQLLETSDVISVMCPLNDETRGLIGPEQFAMMKTGVVFVNTARGPIVQEQALVDALASGKVLRAALDVFEKEPEVHPDLRTNPNVVLSPHASVLDDLLWVTVEREIFDNFNHFAEHGIPATPVNNPVRTD